jgi:hypothetical protein
LSCLFAFGQYKENGATEVAPSFNQPVLTIKTSCTARCPKPAGDYRKTR